MRYVIQAFAAAGAFSVIDPAAAEHRAFDVLFHPLFRRNISTNFHLLADVFTG